MVIKAFRISIVASTFIWLLGSFTCEAAVYYWDGHGQSNDKGFLIDDPQNWGGNDPAVQSICGWSAGNWAVSLNGDFTAARTGIESEGSHVTFDLSPYAFTTKSNFLMARSNQSALLKSGTIIFSKFYCPGKVTCTNDHFVVDGASSRMKFSTFYNCAGSDSSFRVCNGATLEKASAGALPLFFDETIGAATNNRFVVSNATVRNISSMALKGGSGNALEIWNAAFLDADGNAVEPKLSISGGVSNRIDLAGRKMLFESLNTIDSVICVRSASDIVVKGDAHWTIFGDSTTNCLLEVVEGSHVVHTNYNREIQIGSANETACGNRICVSGTGSMLGYNGAVVVGKKGGCSGLLVEDGGDVRYFTGEGGGGGVVYVGQGPSTGNWLRVSGNTSKFAPSSLSLGTDTNGMSNTATFDNGAVAMLSRTIASRVGYWKTETDDPGKGYDKTWSCSNRLEILGGAVVTQLVANVDFNFAGHDNFLVLSNGTLAVGRHLQMPFASAFEAEYARDMHIVVKGERSRIAAGGDIVFSRNTDFDVTIPAGGFDSPLFQAAGEVSFLGVGTLKCSNPGLFRGRVVLAEGGRGISVDASSLATMGGSLPAGMHLSVEGSRLVLAISRAGLNLSFR